MQTIQRLSTLKRLYKKVNGHSAKNFLANKNKTEKNWATAKIGLALYSFIKQKGLMLKKRQYMHEFSKASNPTVQIKNGNSSKIRINKKIVQKIVNGHGAQ